MTRRERFEIVLAAGASEVWRMLTTAEGLSSWLGTTAHIELRIGGDRVVGWGEGEEMVGRVDEIEPQDRLRLVFLTEGVEVGAEEWLIASESGVTRLILIHSMSDDDVDDWEGFYGDIRRGWRLFLASLRHALEGARVPGRVSESRFVPAPGRREEVFARVLERLGPVIERGPGVVEPVAGMEAVLVDPPHSLLLTAADRTLLVDIEGSGPGQALYVQASTHDGPPAWRGAVLDLIG